MKARRVKKLEPEAPLSQNVARMVRVRVDELRQFTPAALERGAVEEQHDMRIAAKRLRYILEATGFCLRDRRGAGAQERPRATGCARRAARLRRDAAARGATPVRAAGVGCGIGAPPRRQCIRRRCSPAARGPEPDRLPWPGGAVGLSPGEAGPALRPLQRAMGKAAAGRHLGQARRSRRAPAGAGAPACRSRRTRGRCPSQGRGGAGGRAPGPRTGRACGAMAARGARVVSWREPRQSG